MAPREIKLSAYARGYTKLWTKRATWFRRQYPLCGMRPNQAPPVMSQCHDEGRTTPASCTDHVIPHRGDQVLFWDQLTNWQSLCDTCHRQKTQAGL